MNREDIDAAKIFIQLIELGKHENIEQNEKWFERNDLIREFNGLMCHIHPDKMRKRYPELFDLFDENLVHSSEQSYLVEKALGIGIEDPQEFKEFDPQILESVFGPYLLDSILKYIDIPSIEYPSSDEGSRDDYY